MWEAGLEELETYIFIRQNMVAQYIVTRPIIDLCLEADRQPGARLVQRWWKNKGIDFTGSCKSTKAEEMVDMEG